MVKPKTVLGWLSVLAVIAMLIAGAQLAAGAAFAEYVMFAFTGKSPSLHEWWEAITSPTPDRWAYKTPESPIWFKVKSYNAPCTVDITLGVKDGETVHVPHQRTPSDTTIHVKHGRHVFLNARNESPQACRIEVQIVDGLEHNRSGACDAGLCLAAVTAEVR